MGLFDGPDGEKLKNLLICNIYATDKEMDEMAPFFVFVILAFLIGLLLYWAFN